MKDRLTSEQSQRLIELGVDPSKASEVQHFDDAVSQWTNRGYAIFTLSDVLSLLPKEIYNEDIIYHCTINIGSYFNEVLYKYNSLILKSFTRGELVDALYELLCWTLTRNKE